MDRPSRFRGLSDRYLDAEYRSLAQPALDPDRSPHELDVLAGNCQPQLGALLMSQLAHLNEGIENARLVFRGDAQQARGLPGPGGRVNGRSVQVVSPGYIGRF